MSADGASARVEITLPPLPATAELGLAIWITKPASQNPCKRRAASCSRSVPDQRVRGLCLKNISLPPE
jgi:hypothetical protein